MVIGGQMPVGIASKPLSGNRCGHSPRSPRLVPEGLPDHTHPFIVELQDSVDALYTRRFWFEGRLRRGSSKTNRQLYVAYSRSERREATICLAKAMLHKTSIANLRIWHVKKDGNVRSGVSIKEWTEFTGLSRDRVKAALQDLQVLGYLGGRRVKAYDEETSKWDELPSIRWWTWKFFDSIGCALKLDAWRRGARKRQRRADVAPPPAADATTDDQAADRLVHNRRMHNRLIRNALASLQKKQDPDGTDATTHMSERLRRRLMEIQVQLMTEHPDWPRALIEQEARSRL